MAYEGYLEPLPSGRLATLVAPGVTRYHVKGVLNSVNVANEAQHIIETTGKDTVIRTVSTIDGRSS